MAEELRILNLAFRGLSDEDDQGNEPEEIGEGGELEDADEPLDEPEEEEGAGDDQNL